MDLVAHASIVIRARRHVVWSALMAPQTIPKIMPVREVAAGFVLGQPFRWIFELAGTPSHVEGHVHHVEEDRRLEWEYEDPHARDVLGVRVAHRVAIELSDVEDDTRVAVIEDGHASEAAHAHAEGGWRLALHNLKALVDSSAP